MSLRDAGEPRAAARVAAQLADLHGGPLGNEAMARGWVHRGRRLLDGLDPCVEEGYLDLARLACDRPDLDDLARSADRAMAIARQFGDVGLEVRALADGGLALVSQGRLADGFARLDEALAMLSAGEVRDVQIVGTSLCSVLARPATGPATSIAPSSRSASSRRSSSSRSTAGRACSARTARWPSAACSARPDGGTRARRRCSRRSGPTGRRASTTAPKRSPAWPSSACTRAGSTRRPGSWPGSRTRSSPPRRSRMVHLGTGDRSTSPRPCCGDAIKRMVHDVLRGAPLLALLVDAEVARGDVPAAGQAADLLAAMAARGRPAVGRGARRGRRRAHRFAAGDGAGRARRLRPGPRRRRPPGHRCRRSAPRLRLDVAELSAGVGRPERGHRVHAPPTPPPAAGQLPDARRPRRGDAAPSSAPPRPVRRRSPKRSAASPHASWRCWPVSATATATRRSPAGCTSRRRRSSTTSGRILAKLGVRSRAEAAAVAARAGI